MRPSLPQLTLLHRLFQVNTHEWPRVLEAWTLRFFFQVGYIIGWTFLTAVVVTQFGITGLPYFYILHAVLMIFGMFMFSRVIYSWQRRGLILFLTLFSVFFLVGATFFSAHQPVFFASLLVVVLSIFGTQLHITLLSFIEELFSPLENQRVLPLIETAEPLGGITAGVLIISFVKFLPGEYLALFWAGSIFLVFLSHLFFRRVKTHVPRLYYQKNDEPISRVNKIRRGVEHVQAIPFLKLLVVVLFLQYMFVHLLEYQYTKSLSLEIIASHHGEEVAHGASGLAHTSELTHGLGALHILFSMCMLFMQLFVSSRLTEKLGVIRAMTLLPLLSFFTSGALLMRFSLLTSVIAKGFYESFLVVYNNGYHNSYYAMYEQIREQIRELLEGLMRPLGIIAGTGVLIGVNAFLPQEYALPLISLGMLLVSGTMAFLLFRMGPHYTHLSKRNIERMGDHPEKFTAIEILAQHGHSDASDILTKALLYRNESSTVKIKILASLGVLRDVRSLPEILKQLSDPDLEVRIAACRALAKFPHLGEHFYSQVFAKHRVISALSELFYKDPSRRMRSAIVKVFASIHHPEVVDLLLEGLHLPDPEVRSDIILIMGMFKDSTISHYIDPFLQDPHPKVRANTIIALWQFKKYRLKLLMPLLAMLESDEKEMKLSGIYTVGAIRAIQEIPRLLDFLEDEDLDVRRYAAIALAKMDNASSVEALVYLVMHPDEETARKTKLMLSSVSVYTRKLVKTLMQQEITTRLWEKYGHTKRIPIEELGQADLKELLYYYELLDEDKEALKIKGILYGHKKDTGAYAALNG